MGLITILHLISIILFIAGAVVMAAFFFKGHSQ
jgi:hypothetical protein